MNKLDDNFCQHIYYLNMHFLWKCIGIDANILSLTITLVQAMAWCRQALNHYLSQCWPQLFDPDWCHQYGVARPQGVKYVTMSWIRTILVLPYQFPFGIIMACLLVHRAPIWKFYWKKKSSQSVHCMISISNRTWPRLQSYHMIGPSILLSIATFLHPVVWLRANSWEKTLRSRMKWHYFISMFHQFCSVWVMGFYKVPFVHPVASDALVSVTDTRASEAAG